MRFATFVVLASAAATTVSAGLFKRQFPNCADSCLANAPLGDCQGDDNHCLCEDSNFVQNTTLCIQQSCTGDDLSTALSDARQLCAAVGVTLTSTFASSSTPSSGASTTGSSNSSAPTSSAGSSSSSSSSSSGSGSAAPSPTAAGGASSGALHHGASAIALLAIGLAAAAL